MLTDVVKLHKIATKETRLIIGLMSGTSLDGLDIALCQIANSGENIECKLLEFKTLPYTLFFKNFVKEVFSKALVDLQKLCILNEYVGITHAEMIKTCLSDWSVDAKKIDLIASHGQTIYHAPKYFHKLENLPNATLQIGDADHIAVHTGIITVSDFRQKHIAAGGEGAPLAVYGDSLLFASADENRILLNIGGISNFTYLTMDKNGDIFTTDAGPGNGLMDAYCLKYKNFAFDKDGKFASEGKVNELLLKELMRHDFFEQALPKSTGPELFDLKYVENAKIKASCTDLSFTNTMATLNMFTAKAISKAIHQYNSKSENTAIYISGGGVHNNTLLNNLKVLLSGYSISSLENLGINPDAKEAILFAILANECVASDSLSNKIYPQISMGKISFPN